MSETQGERFNGAQTSSLWLCYAQPLSETQQRKASDIVA